MRLHLTVLRRFLPRRLLQNSTANENRSNRRLVLPAIELLVACNDRVSRLAERHCSADQEMMRDHESVRGLTADLGSQLPQACRPDFSVRMLLPFDVRGIMLRPVDTAKAWRAIVA